MERWRHALEKRGKKDGEGLQAGSETSCDVWSGDGGTEKTQVAKLEEAELKMFRVSLGVTRMGRIRNVHIRGRAQDG